MSQRGTVLVNPGTGAVVFPSSTITFPSTVVATLFSGIGTGLTQLDADQLSQGTIPNARLDADLQSFITNASWSGSTLTFNNINLQLGTGDLATDGDITGNILNGAEVAVSEIRLANLGTGSFDGSIVYSGTLTAGHTLTLNLSDADRTLQMGGDVFLGANFTTTNQGSLTLTVTGATNVTLPTSGTVYSTGTTDVAIADGGTGASTAAAARTNLGFGTIVKTSDTAKTSDTSPAADPALQFAVAANTNYRFRAWVLVTVAANGPHIKGGFSGPASPTSIYFSTRIWGTTSALSAWNGAFSGYSTTHGTASQLTDNTATYLWELEGTLRNGANAGTFSFDWSQWTSSGSATTVKAGSFIQWEVCS